MIDNNNRKNNENDNVEVDFNKVIEKNQYKWCVYPKMLYQLPIIKELKQRYGLRALLRKIEHSKYAAELIFNSKKGGKK